MFVRKLPRFNLENVKQLKTKKNDLLFPGTVTSTYNQFQLERCYSVL